jgi:PAS domain S-box-containing protein
MSHEAAAAADESKCHFPGNYSSIGSISGNDDNTTPTTGSETWPQRNNKTTTALTQLMNTLVAEHGIKACRQSLEMAYSQRSHGLIRDEVAAVAATTTSTIQQQEHDVVIQHQLNDSIIDAAFDAMFLINGHGIIQKVNKAAILQFGYNIASELLGQNISLLCGDAFSSNHDAYLKSYRETGDSHIIGTMRKVSARRKDGSEFPCKLGIDVIVTNKLHNEMLICGFIRDLTEEKEVIKSHEDLERSMKLNDAIIDASFDAMFLINDYGIIEKVNKAAVAVFGYNNKEELEGRNIHCICGVQYAPHHDRYLEQYRLTRESHIMGSKREVSARRKDGTEFPCQLGLNVMENDDTGEMRMVGFVRDLTAEKRAMELAVEASLSEQLLMNMLPKEIVTRLKTDPKYLADHHASATILFADIVGM